MGAEHWAAVTDLVHRALAVPDDRRRAWVATEAGDNRELIDEVERLLAAHERAGRFLVDPALASPGAAAAIQDALPPLDAGELKPGAALGHYRIIRLLGRGGMGAVYLAARADAVFEKQVAIKVAQGSLLGDALRLRFTRERQILAALDHPGIARVLDGGATASGVPYLVMEYVDGTPIDDHCRAGGLDIRARLRLFVDVCRAVQYAHDRLIIHCDIKPANVLVGHDGRVRLLDFGIARLLSPDDPSGAAAATRLHAWTPESASPEQVRGAPTTVATDVYGLGALLYRLVSGRPVFDLGGLDFVERARIICETGPARPSTAAPAMTAAGGRLAAADLDVITLKALNKDPSRRYRSAEHLAEDVERWLAGRPVTAASDSVLYRGRKFVRRYPFATTIAVAAVLAVLAASFVAMWQARRAAEERDRAQARLADVRRLANTLIFDLYDRVANTPNATPIRLSLVEHGLAYLDRLSADAGEDAQLRVELAGAYLRLAQVQGDRGASNLGDRSSAVASLEKGRALLAPLLAQHDVPAAAEFTDVRLLQRLASAHVGDPQRARALAGESIERSAALSRRYPGRVDVIEAGAASYFSAALVADAADALELWTRSNGLYGELVKRLPASADALRSLALTEKYIGAFHHTANRLDLARPRYERALELDREVQRLRPDDRRTIIDLAFDLGNVASVLWSMTPPDLSRVAALYRESLQLRERAAAEDPQDVFARQALGYVLVQLTEVSRQLHDAAAAIQYGRRSVEVYESLPAGEHLARRGRAWQALGAAARAGGRHAEACDALRRARQRYTDAAGAAANERQMLAADALPSVADALKSCTP